MTIAVIPSRWGSSRFEGKPLAPVAGIPMIRRVVMQAEKSSILTRVIVATDDSRIFDAVTGFGGEAVMTGTDLRSGTDRVAQTADILEVADSEIVINIQGDQPVFEPVVLAELIQPFDTDPDLLMTTLACRITNEREITDPKDVKVCFDRNKDALYFSRAQIPFPRDGQSGVEFYKHLGFYAYRRHFLRTIAGMDTTECESAEKLEQLRVLEHGYRIRVVVTPHDSPEIDLAEDVARIEKNMSTP